MLKYIKFWQTISILHQRFFANIRCLFTLSFCAPYVRSHKSNGRAFFVYTSMAAAQRSAAHLMQQLFDSACHVYNKCVSTYKTCLGNNMCEFSCCNCSPFLFFSVSFTNTIFFIFLSPCFSDHTQKRYLFLQLIINASNVLGTLFMLLQILRWSWRRKWKILKWSFIESLLKIAFSIVINVRIPNL